MKKVLLLLLLVINISCTDSITVYVCNSRNARQYHYKPDCRGLSNCTYRVVKTTIGKAKKQGKTLCSWEKQIDRKH
jgi:hypothetical protein